MTSLAHDSVFSSAYCTIVPVKHSSPDEHTMPDQCLDDVEHTHYAVFSREAWTALGAGIAQPLTDDEIRQMRGVNEDISPDEVAAIYLPVARLLNLQIVAAQQLHRTTASFFQTPAANVPFVIGVAGSVAVGKSTTARILQALLARWPDHPTVDLVTTDGFLLPNTALEERGLAARKGFPESYDWERLRRFVEEVKLGAPAVQAPIYSHLRYDIVPDEFQVVRQPNVLILEGINILQGDSIGQHGVVDLARRIGVHRRRRGTHPAVVRPTLFAPVRNGIP